MNYGIVITLHTHFLYIEPRTQTNTAATTATAAKHSKTISPNVLRYKLRSIQYSEIFKASNNNTLFCTKPCHNWVLIVMPLGHVCCLRQFSIRILYMFLFNYCVWEKWAFDMYKYLLMKCTRPGLVNRYVYRKWMCVSPTNKINLYRSTANISFKGNEINHSYHSLSSKMGNWSEREIEEVEKNKTKQWALHCENAIKIMFCFIIMWIGIVHCSMFNAYRYLVLVHVQRTLSFIKCM